MDTATLKSRTIRECILRVLSIADRAGVAVGFSFQQILDGFATSELEYGDDDVRPDLNDLADDRLVERFSDAARPGMSRYRISSRGRDFVRARFPWGKIDEFTGDQSLL